jgi:hypothetical protein
MRSCLFRFDRYASGPLRWSNAKSKRWHSAPYQSPLPELTANTRAPRIAAIESTLTMGLTGDAAGQLGVLQATLQVARCGSRGQTLTAISRTRRRGEAKTAPVTAASTLLCGGLHHQTHKDATATSSSYQTALKSARQPGRHRREK